MNNRTNLGIILQGVVEAARGLSRKSYPPLLFLPQLSKSYLKKIGDLISDYYFGGPKMDTPNSRLHEHISFVLEEMGVPHSGPARDRWRARGHITAANMTEDGSRVEVGVAGAGAPADPPAPSPKRDSRAGMFASSHHDEDHARWGDHDHQQHAAPAHSAPPEEDRGYDPARQGSGEGVAESAASAATLDLDDGAEEAVEKTADPSLLQQENAKTGVPPNDPASKTKKKPKRNANASPKKTAKKLPKKKMSPSKKRAAAPLPSDGAHHATPPSDVEEVVVATTSGARPPVAWYGEHRTPAAFPSSPQPLHFYHQVARTFFPKVLCESHLLHSSHASFHVKSPAVSLASVSLAVCRTVSHTCIPPLTQCFVSV